MHEHPKFVLLAKFVLFRLKVRFIVQKTFVRFSSNKRRLQGETFEECTVH